MNEKISLAKPPGKKKSKLLAILFLIIALLYGISPVDIIPDVIPVFGLSDDAVALVGALYYAWQAFFKEQP